MNTSIPLSAYQFRSTAPAPELEVVAAGVTQPRRFSGVAYSGLPLRHPYWGVVVFDVASTQAAADKTPILVDHDPSHRAGFAALSFDNHQITITEGTLLDNERGREIAADSDQGFPWQMSVFIDPARIEEITAGTPFTVNGHTLTGPAVIFRDALIREVSFCAVGVDYRTEATALSALTQLNQPQTVENHAMTLDELQAANAALQASLDAAEQRAVAAETQLETQRKAARMSAVQSLFSALGREMSDAAAAPYLAMDEATFSAVAADLKAAKPTAPAHLFSAQATAGVEPDAPQVPAINLNQIYSKRMNAHG